MWYADTARGSVAGVVARVACSVGGTREGEGLYGQRWKVETVISVIKRKFGDGVRSRGLRLARCEVLAKGVAYNLHRSFLWLCAFGVCVGFAWGVSVVSWGIIATKHVGLKNCRVMSPQGGRGV